MTIMIIKDEGSQRWCTTSLKRTRVLRVWGVAANRI